jgi:hypothetical protein
VYFGVMRNQSATARSPSVRFGRSCSRSYLGRCCADLDTRKCLTRTNSQIDEPALFGGLLAQDALVVNEFTSPRTSRSHLSDVRLGALTDWD